MERKAMPKNDRPTRPIRIDGDVAYAKAAAELHGDFVRLA
jgi:hypothetical protein